MADINALLAGLGSANTGASAVMAPGTAAPAAAPQTQGLLAGLLGPQATPYVRSFAAGLANLRPGADPYVAFANGLGGSQQYYSAEEERRRQAALEAKKLAMSQQQQNIDNARADKSLSLQEQNYNTDNERAAAAEKRQALNDDLYRQKVQADLDRMSKDPGVDPNLVLKIDKQADETAKIAAGYDPQTGVMLRPDEYAKVKSQEYDRLMTLATGAKAPGVGPGVSKNTTGQIQPGFVDNGFKFKGGDPNVQSNWEPIQ